MSAEAVEKKETWRDRAERFERFKRVLERFSVAPLPEFLSWRDMLARTLAGRHVRKVTDWNMDSEHVEQIIGDDSPPLVDLREANIVTSEPNFPAHEGMQLPCLDIDVPMVAVPSTTPGHWHLYFDVSCDKDRYFAMLEAMAECGIVQAAWVDASKNRGYSAVRLPWIKKEFVE